MPYFEAVQMNDEEFLGYCFTSPKHVTLGLSFKEDLARQVPPKFVIASVAKGKTTSKLKAGDEVTAIDGKPVASLGKLKSEIYRLSYKKTAPIQVNRKGNVWDFEEPYITLNEGLSDEKTLASLLAFFDKSGN